MSEEIVTDSDGQVIFLFFYQSITRKIHRYTGMQQ